MADDTDATLNHLGRVKAFTESLRGKIGHHFIGAENMMDHTTAMLGKLVEKMENVQMHLIEGSHAQALTEISHAMQLLKDEIKILHPKQNEEDCASH